METYLKLRDGIELCNRSEIPENPKAIVLITHGFAEHMGRYEYTVEKLLSRNYGVYRYDLRGHGRSKSPLGHIDSFDDLILDTNEMVDLIVKENTNVPIFMLGHSMGGLITALYGIEYPNKLKGQIFSGAALNTLPSSKGKMKYVIKIGATILPKVKVTNPINEDLCSVKQVYQDYINDPLVLKKASFNFYHEFVIVAIKKLQDNLKDYNLPCFITHGEGDKISPSTSSVDFYNGISSTDKDYKIYKNLYHEILNENEKDEVIEDMIRWLDERVN